MTLTVERLRVLLSYDPATGIFTRRIATGFRGCYKVGTTAGVHRPGHYTQIMVDGVRTYVHRLAWFYVTGEWPSADVDHRNGTKDANGFANLRSASRSQNQQNRARPRADNTSGYTGVRWDKARRKWVANIMVSGRTRHLGCFVDKDDAAEFRHLAQAMLHPFSRAADELPRTGWIR